MMHLTAQEARALSDPIRLKAEAEQREGYYSSISNMIRCEAALGRNQLLVEASSFRKHLGIAHYNELGFKVTVIEGGRHDPDQYSIEW
jgi:hypothetical protein